MTTDSPLLWAALTLAIFVIPSVMRIWVEWDFSQGAERLAAARRYVRDIEIGGVELPVCVKPLKALVFWFPVLLVLAIIPVGVYFQARAGNLPPAIFYTLLFGLLAYASVRRLWPSAVLVMDEHGITFPRHGVHLRWAEVARVRLTAVHRGHRPLGGSETVICFMPRDVAAVRRRMTPLSRLLSVGMMAYGTPLAVFAAPLDVDAEDVAAMAERYAGRDLARDLR
ncbi:hypothetical protein [Nonomuraea sp. SBT364]|uniref:hypothetical protein n=1 Tax=Nonomuraea sp. SBT364 TaxID=1580530 RepID=UPI00066ACE8C|nr:hypothetical protein [Nonomuraea sp. SBT364]